MTNLMVKYHFVAVLRLSGREPRRVPPVGDDVRQLSQAPRLLHHRHHARQAPRGEFADMPILVQSFAM